MDLLSKTDILSAEDIQYRDEPVPEWGGTVRIVGLSAADRDAYEAAMYETRRGGKSASVALANFRARLLVKCIVDGDGKRLFSDTDAKALGEKNGLIVDRLWDVARELSGIGADAVEQGKANSEIGQSDSSTSD